MATVRKIEQPTKRKHKQPERHFIRLQELAEAKGIEIEQIAEATGINPARIAHYWHKHMRAAVPIIKQLAEAIQVANWTALIDKQGPTAANNSAGT